MQFTSTILYKIDLSFSIKLQEINLHVCEEYKTEREARGFNRTERDDQVARSNLLWEYASESGRFLLPSFLCAYTISKLKHRKKFFVSVYYFA